MSIKQLHRSVIALGVASLLTDLSADMIYPLLPLFLTSVLGAGPVALGAIEGFAESTAAFLKVFSGVWTDRTGRRKPLIVAGYGIAGLARPMIGLAGSWGAVLALRIVDRVGKGLRTSPRDALISDVTGPAIRGMAYGFHRSMDHAGAIAGPLVAAFLLYFLGLSLRTVFLLAAIPAVVVMLVLAMRLDDAPPHPRPKAEGETLWKHWGDLGPDFRRLMLALLVFTLGNSTDAFLLLRLSDSGLRAEWISLLWALHHGVKMSSTYWAGNLSDRIGRRPIILAGWIFYALIYLGFALFKEPAALIALFLAYGLYFGLTEPTERALISDLVPAALRGTAFGIYHFMIGLAALPASLIFGWLWYAWGAPAAFCLGASLSGLACLLLAGVRLPARESVSV